jgi:hypothetical protein
MRSVEIRACFPGYGVAESELVLVGRGTGSSLVVATNRAFREVMRQKPIKNKSPKIFRLEIISGYEPWWKYGGSVEGSW